MTKKTDERVIIDIKALKRLRCADFVNATHGKVARHLGVHQTIVTRAYASDEKGNGVSPALLNAMVAKGYLDAHEVNEVLTVAVTPCPECGEAHTVPWCTDKDGEPVKPVYNRKGPKRKHPPTLKIRTDDVDSAAASILRSYPAKLRPALLERLADAATEE